MAKTINSVTERHLPAERSRKSGNDSIQDAPILEAWERRRKAYIEYETLHSGKGPGYTPRQKALWDIIDSADELISSTVATTLEGVEAQLWASLNFITFDREGQKAILCCDLEYFSRKTDDLDLPDGAVLAAIRSVRGMNTVAALDFDAADWVARFEAVGGYITPNGMGWQIYERSREEQSAAREIYRELEESPERRQAVEAFASQPEQVARYYRSFDREQ